jgi:hypothetical protein
MLKSFLVRQRTDGARPRRHSMDTGAPLQIVADAEAGVVAVIEFTDYRT